MAAQQLTYFLILLFIKPTKPHSVHFKLPEIQQKNFDMKSHLKFENIWDYCNNRDTACASNNTNVCAMKMKNNKKIYKEFKNGCYLFLSNMCDHPEEEYFIVTSGNCEEYFATRRTGDDDPETPDNDEETNNSTEINTNDYGDNDNQTENPVEINTDAALRKPTPFSPLYDVDESYDFHPCPHSCPNTYDPQCVNVNRGFGKYFKMLNFVNHCSSDIYYCKHWAEFAPPPNEYENVKSSPLGWSFCGASRYLQFARFSEGASSMAHYGWLAGDYKYSHIMAPHERLPGFG